MQSLIQSCFTTLSIDLAYDFQRQCLVTDSADGATFTAASSGVGLLSMPANNQALLANGYVFFHGKNGENTD